MSPYFSCKIRNYIKFDRLQKFWYNTHRRGDYIMIVLALDLSTRSSGYALGVENSLEKHGFISASNTNPIKRIIKMRDVFKKYL